MSLRRFTVASVLTLLLSTLAHAAPAPDPEPAPQRHFGLGPTAGIYSGFGVTIGGGGDFLKGWFTGGFVPVVIFANSRVASRAVRVNYYNSFQINEDIALHVFTRPRLEGALLLGYKYNTVFGHGGGAGVGVIYDLGPRVGLAFSAGLAIFPSAKDRLIRDQGYPTDRDPPLTPAIQAGGNVGLVFFP